MVQKAVPSSDISDGNWTAEGGPTDHYDCVDTVNGDADYIEDAGNNTTAEIALSAVNDPVSSTGHTIRFRMQGNGSGGPERCAVQLWEGANQRASTGTQTSRAAWGDKEYTLSAAEADSITSYSGLSLKIISSNLVGGETMWVSFAEFEVPDASVPLTGTSTDTLGISDSVASLLILKRTETDTVGISDAIADKLTARRLEADTVGISDSVSDKLTAGRAVIDTAGISDNVIAAVKHRRSVADTIGFGTPDLSNITRVIDVPLAAETIGFSDSTASATQAANLTGSTADTVGISDNVIAAVKHRRSVADTVGAGDSLARAATMSRIVSATIGISDSVSKSLAGTLTGSVADTVGISDSVSDKLTAGRAVIDTAGISDNVIAAVKHRRSVADTIGFGDSLTRAASSSVPAMAHHYRQLRTPT